MNRDELDRKAYAIVADEIARRGLPQTQYECCVIGACVSLTLGSWPLTDSEFIDAAHGAARGLFGESFDRASEGQRWDWIDMCERALREVAKEMQAPCSTKSS